MEIIINSDSNTISGLSSDEGLASTYEGNVILAIGNIEIRGEKAVVTFDSETNEISIARILGNPVQFEQTNQEGIVITNGSSEVIEFLEESFEIILRGSATLSQQGAYSSCEEITYNINTELFNGIGSCEVRVMRNDSQTN